MPIPHDIFTEPDDVDPDTLANLGPLRRLAGIWEGQMGDDVNPKADGPEQRVYLEHIEMQPIDPQTNGPQLFYGLRYHTHINTTEEQVTSRNHCLSRRGSPVARASGQTVRQTVGAERV